MPERTIDPEWPAPTAVAPVAEEVAIEFVGSVESIAPVEIVAPVEATVPTAESASRRHTEEQLISERTPVDEGKAGLVARFMARLRPVSTPTAAVVEARSAIEGSNGPATDAPELVRPVEAGPADEPTATEFERPLELAKPAWVETDLTELVDAIAEPADDPELVIPSDVRPTDSVVELPSLDDARDALTLREPQGHPEQGRGVSDIRKAPPAPTVQVPEAPPPAASRPKATRPANRKRRARPAPKDDWHFFDPEETRFAALLAKLDEITGTDAASHS
jgi:hypothetical protein